ncbi:MAG: hypothetical protein RIR52_2256 [Acidobacteriota bacterium]|jgi:hypothetical protein
MQRHDTLFGLLVFSLPLLIGTACREEASSAPVATVAPSIAERRMPERAEIDKVIRRIISYDGCRDLTAEMRLTSTDANGRRDQVQLRVERSFDEVAHRTFLQVVAPAEDADKALLAVQSTGQPTEAFSYLPGLRKLARLNSGRSLGFRGARVTVQELLGLELGQYDYEVEGPTDEAGTPGISLLFTAKSELGLAYPKIRAILDGSTLLPLRFILIGTGGEIQKRIRVEKSEEIESRLTLSRFAIEDLTQQLTLTLEMVKVDYDRGLKETAFTEERLKRTVSAAAAKGRE